MKAAFSRVMFSADSPHWATPTDLYDALHAEFGFTFDPCPLGEGTDGLSVSWAGQRVYCNPPYGRGIGDWLAKASEADLAVYLLPSRTDTKWFHAYAPRAADVRFLRGRLTFGTATAPAPFPSLVLVYR